MAVAQRLLAIGFGTSMGLVVSTAALCVFGGMRLHVTWSRNDRNTMAIRRIDSTDLLASMIEREPPPPDQKAFDPRELSCSPAVTADGELADIATRIAAVVEGAQRNREYADWQAFVGLGGRLYLFPWRFGSDPRQQSEWPTVEAAAAAALHEMETVCSTPAKRPSETFFRSFLLDILGRTSEAAGLLRATASASPHPVFDSFPDVPMYWLKLRESEQAEDGGDAAQARELLTAAILESRWRDLTDDASLARLGLLMLQSGRPEGSCVLQLVADLDPGTPGAEVARSALAQIGALRESTPERLLRVYVLGLDPFDARALLATRRLSGLPR